MENTQSKQWLPLGWKVIAGWGILNIFFAIIVPLTSLLFSPKLLTFGVEDAKFIGMSWEQIVAMSPNMDLWMVLMMATMCAMMMGYGILTFDVARKAYRNGERWAWKTLLVSNALVLFPYFVPITWLYAAKGLYGMFTSSGAIPSGINIGIPFTIIWIAVIYVGLWLPRKEVR